MKMFPDHVPAAALISSLSQLHSYLDTLSGYSVRCRRHTPACDINMCLPWIDYPSIVTNRRTVMTVRCFLVDGAHTI